MGLPRIHRLKSWREFRDIYAHGIRRHSQHLVLKALSTPTSDISTQPKPTLIGISISKKVSKKAVERNRIKRSIRAVLITLLPEISDGWKIVIIVKSQATECKYEHFLRELKELLKETKIINGY